jgi:hypothetical protein
VRRSVIWAIGVALVGPGMAHSQEVHRYHERTDGVVTVSTPNGPMEIRSEHDAVIAVETVRSDSLHAWYEELAVASVSPMAETRPDASGALGELFVLRVGPTGHVETLQAPEFPASFEGVTDLTAQFFDFFPSRPASGFSLDAAWTDTIFGPPAKQADTEMDLRKVTRYRITEETERDGVAVFVIQAEARLDFVVEGPVPDQPGLRVKTTMRGVETNVFVVAKGDGALVTRHRTAELAGEMEYIGPPQPVVLPMTRNYESTIDRVRR